MAAQTSPAAVPDIARIDALRNRNDELGLGVEDLNDSVESVGEATERTSASTALAAEATDHVAGAAAAVSAAAEQLEASMREVSATSNTSLEVAMRAESAMVDVRTRVDNLNESAGHISSVVTTVSRISSQTRMLALNATIEAARAGEAGRGFAVVAAEVKELAGQTSAATVEITDRLESLAADTEAVSEAVTTIGEVLARVEELQQTIAAAVEQQTAAIGELNRSASESAMAAGSLQESVAASADAAEQVQAALSRARMWMVRVKETVAGQRGEFSSLLEGVQQHPVSAAVVSHAEWKNRLRAAIDTKRLPAGMSIQQVGRDDQCDFGKWLHSGEGAAQDPRRAAAVTNLHASFHTTAAAILNDVATGNVDSARHKLSAEDGYAGVAHELTDELISWGHQVAQAGRRPAA